MKNTIYFILITLLFIACRKDDPVEEDQFKGDSGEFTDTRDNQTYNWVRIGDQIWMDENLAFLPSVNPYDEGSSTEPFYYVYDYLGTSAEESKSLEAYSKYGVLYNWPAAGNACPEGWHIPTNDEWEQLALFVQGNCKLCEKVDENSWYYVARYLKSTSGWGGSASFGNGTDDYGFSAKPGGHKNENSCDFGGRSGYWWTNSPSEGSKLFIRAMSNSGNYLTEYGRGKNFGLSVRCIKDTD